MLKKIGNLLDDRTKLLERILTDRLDMVTWMQIRSLPDRPLLNQMRSDFNRESVLSRLDLLDFSILTQLLNKPIISTTMNSESKTYVYALVYENPEIFNWEADDIHTEVLGVYQTIEEAETALALIEDQTFYEIEKWSDEIPF